MAAQWEANEMHPCSVTNASCLNAPNLSNSRQEVNRETLHCVVQMKYNSDKQLRLTDFGFTDELFDLWLPTLAQCDVAKITAGKYKCI